KVDEPNILAAPIRALAMNGTDGSFQALRELRNYQYFTPVLQHQLRTEIHNNIAAENAELTNTRHAQQFEDHSNANQIYQKFVQNSLNPKTTLEDMEAMLQQPTMRESLTWETGSLYDNAVSYVATLKERQRAQREHSDRQTLTDVETGVYVGRMADGSRMRD